MIRVVDVSQYQGPIDWPKLRRDLPDVEACIVRATIGATGIDSRAAANLAGAAAAGLEVSAYHAWVGGVDAVKQADNFARVAAGKLTFRPWLDVEREDNQPHAQIEEQVCACLEAIDARFDRDAGVYTGKWFLDQVGIVRSPRLARRDLWLADYRTAPSIPAIWSSLGWVLWQYTDSARGPHTLDCSYYRGTRAQLAAMGLRGADDVPTRPGSPSAIRRSSANMPAVRPDEPLAVPARADLWTDPTRDTDPAPPPTNGDPP